MKKFILIPMALGALGLGACGQSTSSNSTVTQPAAAVKSAGDNAGNAIKGAGTKVAQAPKTDLALCSTLRGELSDLATTAQRANTMSDSEAETFATNTLQPEVEDILSNVGQLRDEATTASDQRRLDQVTTGLGTMNGGLTALGSGDYSGVGMISQGYGQITTASGNNDLLICGGAPSA